MNVFVLVRALYPKTPEYTFFFGTLGIFMKTNNVLGHKDSLNMF